MRLHILGSGGHAKVAIEAWRSSGGEIAAVHDDDPARRGLPILDLSVAGRNDEAVRPGNAAHIAIGDNKARARIAADCEGISFPPVVHAVACVSPSAVIGDGTLVCSGAVIQADAKIGRHAIINSLALIEHDVEVGAFAHIAPGVRVGGGVRIGEGTLIGIGAVILPCVSIGAHGVVGAGAVVIRDVPDGARVVGNPARLLRSG